MGDTAMPKDEEIECPICKKGKIHITIIPEHYSTHAARAFGKVKLIPVIHHEKVNVHSRCPSCGASKNEIKEGYERGTSKKMSHEERLRRLKEAGIPTVVTTEPR